VKYFRFFLLGVLFFSQLKLSGQIKTPDFKNVPADINKALKKASHAAVFNPESSSVYSVRALQLSIKEHSATGIAYSRKQIGINYQLQGNNKESLYNLLAAEHIFDSLGDKKNLAGTFMWLGTLYYQVGSFPQANKYFDKAMSIHNGLKDTMAVIHSNVQLIMLFEEKNEFKKALEYCYKNLELCKMVKKESVIRIMTMQIGVLKYRLGDYKDALVYLKKAIDYFKNNPEPNALAGLYAKTGRAEIAVGNITDAQKYELLALHGYSALKARGNLPFIYENLALIEETKKNYPAAIQWFHLKDALKDSLSNETRNKQMAEMQAKYESAKKEKIIAQLSQKQTEQKSEKARLLWVIYFGAIVAMSLLAMALFLYKNNNKVQKLNLQLEAQKEQLLELNSIKNKLFSAISHDLRTPLNRLDTFLVLLKDKSLTEDKVQSYTAELSEALQHTIQLLDNLLYWAANQIKVLKINQSEVSMQELVEENIYMARNDAERKNIELVPKLSGDMIVYTDMNMANLVLRNLLSNAIKFTPQGGEVEVEVVKKSDNIIVSVSDNGLGMDEETLNNLFKSSVNESRPGTNNEKGFGIGLGLCKEFIEKNGGRLYVESTQGKGSTFSFTIPILPAIA
jgi:two-component system sensor histidine kinase/response regulator